MDTLSTGAHRLLRLHEVADRLAISTSMAWKLIAYGHLPSVPHRTRRAGPTRGP